MLAEPVNDHDRGISWAWTQVPLCGDVQHQAGPAIRAECRAPRPKNDDPAPVVQALSTIASAYSTLIVGGEGEALTRRRRPRSESLPASAPRLPLSVHIHIHIHARSEQIDPNPPGKLEPEIIYACAPADIPRRQRQRAHPAQNLATRGGGPALETSPACPLEEAAALKSGNQVAGDNGVGLSGIQASTPVGA
ncbi:hypothetical protein FA95DRAFT_1611739 [Auriscalpium vulgare]|uniref:Uncharacterized protein n=1 Tax=Auriscalpium vulgare TaxID=40419 RepID=A0ACB8R8R2_9AGAM|nr:hypothetical protein FA95DRAFT_1611739 [Auriscalpium vulgare]